MTSNKTIYGLLYVPLINSPEDFREQLHQHEILPEKAEELIHSLDKDKWMWNIHDILSTRPHNSHYLARYAKFILCCKIANTMNMPDKGEVHHICPKAKDLFPEHHNLKQNKWNSIRLSYRQHILAHWLLWKAYGGSQTYSFFAMNNQVFRRDGLTISNSKVYESVKIEVKKIISTHSRGMASYVDRDGNKIRCKTDDPRVISGELTSTSKGRKYAPRSTESRERMSKISKGRKLGPMTTEKRMARRTVNHMALVLYYDPVTDTFLECDVLLKLPHYIKVYQNEVGVWDSDGNYKRVSSQLPRPPDGYTFFDPTKMLRVINLDTMEYTECNKANLPERHHIMELCNNGGFRKTYCIPLKKNIFIDPGTINVYGIPLNCRPLPEVKPRSRVPSISIRCEHCGDEFKEGHYKRWHGDNCKLNPDKPK